MQYDFLPFDESNVAEGANQYTGRNHEMNQAWQFVASTDVSVFLTGKAGTGKTTFLKKLRQLMPKRMVVLAPTGVAAINAEGQTIHSFFQLPFGPYIPGANVDQSQRFRMPQSKKELIRTLDLLVIDEISMVRADLLDQVDDALRRLRDRTKPFGGVQLLLIGDLMQLAPVAKSDEWGILSKYYETPYFFSSHALRQLHYVTIELTHIYRQQDEAFIDLLAQVRDGHITDSVISRLNTRYVPGFRPTGDDWIRLTTHNAPAQRYNEQMLESLPAELHTFEAEIRDDFPEYSYPADACLCLKEGAQVMFIKNDPTGNHDYFNGKIGIVSDITEQYIEILCNNATETVRVQPVTWENTKFTLNPVTKEIEEQTVGTFRQYPLRLAWAITVHKSQGLTFDHAVLDINAAFTHGQVYVALSRCRTLEGLVLSEPVTLHSVLTDASVNGFINERLSHVAENVARLPEYIHDYTLTLLDQLYDLQQIDNDYHWLVRVVDEYLSRQQPALLALLKSNPEPLAQLKAIAARFSQQYRQTLAISHRIAGTPLEGRICDSCGYFDAQLHAVMAPILKQCAINIENKQTADVYNNALMSLRQNIAIKSEIFACLQEQGFSIHNYLSIRAKALLRATSAPARPRARAKVPKPAKDTPASSQEPATPKPKRVKGDSARETFALYQQHLSVAEIAEKRQLAHSTIYKHLSDMVAEGCLEPEDVVSPERILTVRKVVDGFDDAYQLTQVMERVPEGYSKEEVAFILRCLSD